MSYDEVLTRFGDSDAPDLQFLIAGALSGKGDVQVIFDDYTSAVVSYDEVLTRFDDSDAPDLQFLTAGALSGKGDVQVKLGDYTSAVVSYDEVLTRFGDSDTPDLQERVIWALFDKGVTQIKMDRAEEALHICEEIERRLSALTGNEKTEFTWRARYVRTLALMVLKKHRVAVDAFRSAYAVFVPDNEMMMYEMLQLVPDLIAKGASERELVDILSSDKEKSDALVPLIVALKQRTGEEVRAPVEVLEVAKDINKDIDRRMAD